MSNTHEHGWESCPVGTLATFSQQQRKTTKRRKAARIAGVASTVMASCLLIGAVVMWPGASDPDNQRNQPERALGCREVISRMDSYLAGKLAPLEMPFVKTHLTECNKCKLHYEERADVLGLQFSLALRSAWRALAPGWHLLLGSG